MELLTSAHLLCNHNSERCEGSAPDTRNCEELGEAADVVGLAGDKAGLDAELGEDVVKIASCLELGVSEPL